MKPRQKQKTKVLQADMTAIWLKMLGFASAALAVLCLSGCASSNNYASLAPPPPISLHSVPGEASNREQAAQTLSEIEVAAGSSVADYGDALAVKSESLKAKGCRLKDRFDRKYLVSYRWGDENSSVLGLKVKGVNYDSAKVEGVKLEYTLRLQPIRKKIERCRSDSSWQGLVPTAYHEAFVREHDTVWQELRTFKNDIEDRF